MTTFVAGASGATGRLLVHQLRARGEPVRVVVRAAGALPAPLRDDPGVSVTEHSLLDLDDAELARQVAGCRAVASCLGHNLSVRGMFGPPRRLVRDATRRLCAAIRATEPAEPVRFVLMNTAGNRNRDLDEPVSLAQGAVLGLLRTFLPPHADNEDAADELRLHVGQADPAIQWAVVRPDGLIDAETVTPYALHPSPTRSAIFDAGTTSRINVADFMARLICEDALWSGWQGRMPVIYNEEVA